MSRHLAAALGIAAMLRRILFITFCIAASVSSAANAQSSKYVVDHIRLGASVNHAATKHDCEGSDDFSGFVWCHQEPTNANNHVSKTIMYEEQSGAAVYLMVNVASAFLSKGKVDKEIIELSNEFKEVPFWKKWMPSRKGVSEAVIALWGQVRLEELGPDALPMLKAGKSPHQGVLVDYMGDYYRSARNGLPVYRVRGGAGYLYAASFDDEGRGHRHYVAVDASKFGRPGIVEPPQINTRRPSPHREICSIRSGAFIGVETFDLIEKS